MANKTSLPGKRKNCTRVKPEEIEWEEFEQEEVEVETESMSNRRVIVTVALFIFCAIAAFSPISDSVFWILLVGMICIWQ